MPSDRRSMVPWLSCPEGTGKIPRGDRSHMTLADTLRGGRSTRGDAVVNLREQSVSTAPR